MKLIYPSGDNPTVLTRNPVNASQFYEYPVYNTTSGQILSYEVPEGKLAIVNEINFDLVCFSTASPNFEVDTFVRYMPETVGLIVAHWWARFYAEDEQFLRTIKPELLMKAGEEIFITCAGTGFGGGCYQSIYLGITEFDTL